MSAGVRSKIESCITLAALVSASIFIAPPNVLKLSVVRFDAVDSP